MQKPFFPKPARLNILQAFIVAGAFLLSALPSRAAWHVATNGADAGNDGLSWDQPLLTISNAVAKASAAALDTILVSNGTYDISYEISVAKPVTITGLNGRTNTIVRANAAFPDITNRCFYLNHTSAVLQELTITNGGWIKDVQSDLYRGGGIMLQNGTVRECLITGNSAFQGGGVFMKGGGSWRYSMVSNCVIQGNICSNSGSASGGGGVSLRAGILKDCLVMNNTDLGPICNGGGVVVYCDQPSDVWSMSGCSIISNVAHGSGGGCYYYSILTNPVIDCHFDMNKANTYGGGIRMGAFLILSGGSVNSNTIGSYYGAGISAPAGLTASNISLSYNYLTNAWGGAGIDFSGTEAVFDNCEISYNRTACLPAIRSGQYGGGMYFRGSNLTVRNSRFTGNTIVNSNAVTGGAIYSPNNKGAVLIENCLIRSNAITAGNSGAYCRGGGLFISSNAVIRNCEISANEAALKADALSNAQGGGIYVANANCANAIESCTIANNYSQDLGPGIYLTGNGQDIVRNCIVQSNFNAATSTNWYFGDNSRRAFVSFTCTPEIMTGEGNTTADPQFIDFAAGNFGLNASSPCINTGTNRDWMAGAADLGGFSRLDKYSGRVDMGCYESRLLGTIFKCR